VSNRVGTFGLVRIDDRLIHGQVVALWVKHLQARRIVIVDDQVAKDSFLQLILRGAAPPGVTVDVSTIEDAPQALDRPESERRKTIVLMKGPKTAVGLRNAGVQFDTLNVGGMGAGPGRKPFYRNISASQDELDMFRQLESLGITAQIQIEPNARAIAVASHLPPKT
jgi:mannose/fructose/N-acetylgalactosamine-specific phosphotransferase system component IIB